MSYLRASVEYQRTSAPAGAVIVSEEVNGVEWDRYVHSHPASSAYHQWRWRHVFERAFGHETLYLGARENGALVGVLPLVVFRRSLFGTFLVSLPFVNYGGVVARDERISTMLAEAAAAAAKRRGASHVELRHRVRTLVDLPAKSHKVAMLLPLLPDVERAWNALDKKVRNHIRKAEKSDLEVRTGGLEWVPEFYSVFAENMRDLGTPVYPQQLFEQVITTFPQQARIVLVTHRGEPVAGALSYAFRDTVEVPWASSLRAFRPSCPNHLMYWTIIRQAIADGRRTFDFGRSTPGEGTFQFKTQWGAEAKPLHWEYALLNGTRLPDQSPKNPKFRAAIEVWKRCPLWFTNTVGPRIVRSLP